MLAEMTVTFAGASALASARERGMPEPVAVLAALQIAFATCLALVMIGGASG